MGAVITLLVFLVLAFFVVAALRRLFKWAWGSNGKRAPIDHSQLNVVAEEAVKATRTAAIISSAAAYSLAPTGLAALGAKVGLVSVPIIVVLAPQLSILAGAVVVVAYAINLYSKHRRRKDSSS
jgi:Na+-transporting methylmalonyl-CoA/oxaloacetate decarboxylase gamma subunit